MTAAPRPHDDHDERQLWSLGEISKLGALVTEMAPAFAGGRTAPDRAVDLVAWLCEHGVDGVGVEQPQIEALVAVGVLGRVVSAGEARLVWIAGSAFAQPGTSPAVEIDSLARAARALETIVPPGESVPTAIEVIATRIADRGISVEVTARQIESLVALGVLGRVTSAGMTNLVWMRHGWSTHVTGSSVDPPELEEFRLDLSIDVEHERLLLYRIALIFELIVAIVIVRQLLVGAF